MAARMGFLCEYVLKKDFFIDFVTGLFGHLANVRFSFLRSHFD